MPSVEKGCLPAGQIAAAIHEIDPDKPPREVRDYLLRGLGLVDVNDTRPRLQTNSKAAQAEEAVMGVSNQGYDLNARVNLDSFLTHLKKGLVHKSGHYRAHIDLAKLIPLISEKPGE